MSSAVDSCAFSSISTDSTQSHEDRWQTHVKSLKEGIAHLYETKEFADVTFRVEDREFKAHRLFIASRSPELSLVIFESDPRDTYTLSNVTPVGFELLLKYIYTDKLETTDEQDILKVYCAASLYKVKGLESKCEDIMNKWEIKCENVCSLLSQAHENKIEILRKRCVEFIKNNGKNVLKSEEFLNANFDTVEEILKSTSLNQVPLEMKIDCIMEWARGQFPKEMTNFQPVREFMSPLLQYLKLPQLPLEKIREFARKYPGFFDDSEIAKIVLGDTSEQWNLN